jgi:hypothetical protein
VAVDDPVLAPAGLWLMRWSGQQRRSTQVDLTAVDLTANERAALVRLIRRALDETRYIRSRASSIQLKGILAKLEPPPPLHPEMTPGGARDRRRMIASHYT